MQKTRIIISKAELTALGLLITEMKVIDGVSGEPLRITKITPALLDFLKTIEIGIDDYFQILKQKDNNPAFKKLIETFKLYTDV